MITQQDRPVEFIFAPATCYDGQTLQRFIFDLTLAAQVAGDRAYNDCKKEDPLTDAGIRLRPIRR